MRKQPLIPKPKPKKVSKSTLSKKADNLAGEACRARGYCEARDWARNDDKRTQFEAWQEEGYSGVLKRNRCSDRLEWAHIKSRSRKNIRWEPWNCVCLCNQCHRFFTQHPDLWTKFIDDYDPFRWDYLNKRLMDGDKPNPEYWIQFYKEGHDIDHRRSPAVFNAS